MNDYFFDIYMGAPAINKSVIKFITVTFKKEEWAPGVWAGMEGVTINLFDGKAIIRKVDLEERSLGLEML